MPLSRPPAASAAPAVPYVDHLRQESRLFWELIAGAAGGERVPTCPDWDADDLLWHLGEVQWYWGMIAERGLTREDEVQGLEAAREERPADRAGLLAHFERASERLQRMLRSLDPRAELWMWHTDHSAGYISRRQAHEALIHRIDAELTVGAERSPVDCRLAADGVDEALRVMRGYPPEYGLTASPLGPSVTIAVVDGFHTWTVTPVQRHRRRPGRRHVGRAALRGHGRTGRGLGRGGCRHGWRPRLLALEPAGPWRDLPHGRRGGAGPRRGDLSSLGRLTPSIHGHAAVRGARASALPRGLPADDGHATASTGANWPERTASMAWSQDELVEHRLDRCDGGLVGAGQKFS